VILSQTYYLTDPGLNIKLTKVQANSIKSILFVLDTTLIDGLKNMPDFAVIEWEVLLKQGDLIIDSVVKSTNVNANGFDNSFSMSGLIGKASSSINSIYEGYIPPSEVLLEIDLTEDALKSPDFFIEIYKRPINIILDSISSFKSQPMGCFEQITTSVFLQV
jgi:hypothetical protein